MGLLVDGKWVDQWYDTEKSGGKFEREAAKLRNWVTADGSAGPSGSSGFKAETGRYHLYVSLACPWAHRTLIVRSILGLEDVISASFVHPHMLENGWEFKTEPRFEHAGLEAGDTLYGSEFMHQIYTKNQSDYSGRVTVPVLWDKEQKCIVSNESSEIIRMLNRAFRDFTDSEIDITPEKYLDEIDQVNEVVYHSVNNGVYKAGFATSQEPYEEACQGLFKELDNLERHLEGKNYLVADLLTEADIRLNTTLIRFDPVYVGHFKCNLRRIYDYPNLSRYLKSFVEIEGVEKTISIPHIKEHYYYSHATINPTRVVPLGPLD